MVSGAEAGFAVFDERLVPGLTHELHQFVAVAQVNRVLTDVGLGVRGAVPVEVMPAGSPTRPVVLADGNFQVLGAIGTLYIAIRTANWQLPANIRLSFDDADPSLERQLVKRAPGAGGEAWAIQKNARTVNNAGLSRTLFVLLRHLLGPVVLPVVWAEFGCPFLDPFLIVLVRIMRTESATTVVGTFRIDALTA